MGVHIGTGIEQQRGHLDGFRDDGVVERRPADLVELVQRQPGRDQESDSLDVTILDGVVQLLLRTFLISSVRH